MIRSTSLRHVGDPLFARRLTRAWRMVEARLDALERQVSPEERGTARKAPTVSSSGDTGSAIAAGAGGAAAQPRRRQRDPVSSSPHSAPTSGADRAGGPGQGGAASPAAADGRQPEGAAASAAEQHSGSVATVRPSPSPRRRGLIDLSTAVSTMESRGGRWGAP